MARPQQRRSKGPSSWLGCGLGVLALLGGGCASDEPPEDPAPEAVTPPAETDDPARPGAKPRVPSPLARLLELEDRRVADAEAFAQLLANPASDLRARAARAVGRLRRAELSGLLAARLAQEDDAAVRAELIFALGQCADPERREALKQLLASEDPRERALACGALAKLGEARASAPILRALGDRDPEVRAQALLALVRLRGRRVQPPRPFAAGATPHLLRLLERLLGDEEGSVARCAAYALANLELPGRLPLLEQALSSVDPAGRLAAVRGLGRLEGDEAQRAALLVALLTTEADPHVAANAARVVGELGGHGEFSALQETVRRDYGPGTHHVRAAALGAVAELATRHPLPPALQAPAVALLREALSDPSRRVQAAALVALVRVDAPAAGGPLGAAGRAADPWMRQAAVRAVAALPPEKAQGPLFALSSDTDPRVATEALTALSALATPAAGAEPDRERVAQVRQAALRALYGEDLAIRSTGLQLLGEHGQPEDLELLVAVYREEVGFAGAELRGEALAALAKLGEEEALPPLRQALEDPSPAVRQAAATAIAEITGKAPELPPVTEKPSSASLREGRDVGSDAPNPRAILHTTRGPIVLELLREEAPRHVRSFLQLAAEGFYDGLSFHRVVTGFVIQGLDPRGDGWGTGDVFLRDEINPVPYLRGAVGMPNSGPDSGGCQLFITHIPTPHLDGRYTVFARVVEGLDHVDAIEVGDLCQRVETLR